MPPRIRWRALAQLADGSVYQPLHICRQCRYATASAVTPAASDHQQTSAIPSMTRYSSVQPPSYRDPRYRKSQLIRSYVSLLQSTPLIILFQHNNLRAVEWASLRRELANALQKVDEALQAQGNNASDLIADHIKLQVVQTNMLEPALRITEYYKPIIENSLSPSSSSSPPPAPVPVSFKSEKTDPALTHVLSTSAYKVSQRHKNVHPLTPLLVGNIALLTFPTVSPQHLKVALSILSPLAPTFPAPTRRTTPSYHEPAVQDGVKKLMLLGARVDGQIFDTDGTRWVGGIEGGIDGLRAQLVYMLQGFGAGLTQTLEGASRSLWFTMEGRRRMLEEENNGDTAGENKST